MSRRLLGILAFNCAALACLLFGAGVAEAAASITVTPHTNLTDGQNVTVSGSGFSKGGGGAIVQCNPDPGAPTVPVPGSPQPVPVGCSNPLDHIVSFDSNGTLTAKQFPVKKGTVGPPAQGQDSAGNDAAADAAKYPCPPTADQQSKFGDCVIAVGDSSNNRATQAITFSQTTATTTSATTANTAAATTETTAEVTPTQPARTGPSTLVIALALGGVIVLDAGYLLFSSARRPRPSFRRRD